MKKTLFLLMTCCLFNLFSFSQEKAVIEGYITGLKDSTLIHLMKNFGNSAMEIKQVYLINNRFRVEYTPVSKLDQLSMNVNVNEQDLIFYAAPKSKIVITGEGVFPLLWKVKSDVKEQAELNQYEARKYDIYVKIKDILSKKDSIGALLSKQHLKTDSIKYKDLEEKFYALSLKIDRRDLETIMKSPVSNYWMEKLLCLSNENRVFMKDKDVTIKLKQQYMRLNEKQKKSDLGEKIRRDIFPAKIKKNGDYMAVGKLTDKDGKIYTLSEFKGKYILLDFWFSFCGGCISFTPTVNQVCEKYKDKLNVIGINVDDENLWKNPPSFIPEHKFINLHDAYQLSGLALEYGVNSYPTFVLISPVGKILDKMILGSRDLTEFIESNIK